MKIEIITKNDTKVASVVADGIIMNDAQDAIDLMMNVNYGYNVKNIAISKKLLNEKFFILSSGLAGEILQKFINYKFRIAIYGDFSVYNSKPLKDFIYESNNGKDVFFTQDLQSAVEKLSATLK